ncbi:hypothetical protein P8C59_002996 [Phyllachora maydis]|uniref:HORMA domain-containing protein n=1 Tax=Phyllachora maydis TaxID=1825666 RepID=A0AAD9MAZ4_9PEZI|nr:hypothetical protein P8C59_002996 [Phyllachora maydis]
MASTTGPPALPLPASHALLSAFSSFLTVTVHNLLYYRALYPRPTFLSARAFALPVHQSRHPAVCAWVRDAVAAIAAQLASGQVARVAFVVHAPLGPLPPPTSTTSTANSFFASPSDHAPPPPPPPPPPGTVLERWLFDVSRFPAWPGGAAGMRDFGTALTRAARSEDKDSDKDRDSDNGNVNWADVDEQFRGAVARVAAAAERMAELPPGCTYTMAVELREEAEAPIGHPQAWIPSEPNLQPATRTRPWSVDGADIGGAKTTPVRSVAAGPLFFECWVEEGNK